MRGAGVSFIMNMSANLPPVCSPNITLGDEQRAHCLRWPARALTAKGACPGGESDVDPFMRDTLGLPICQSTASSLIAGGATASERSRGAPATNLPCLIYSFGIGGNARWEHHMARALRCEVHAFDPTIRLREAHMKRASSTPGPRHGESALQPWPASPGRLFFHFAGLRGGGVAGGGVDHGSTSTSVSINTTGGSASDSVSPLAAAGNERLYGSIDTSVLHSLPELMRRLGHDQRGLDVLKLDCEVCATCVSFRWDTASCARERIPAEDDPRPQPNLVRMHFSLTSPDVMSDLGRVASGLRLRPTMA